MDRERNQQIANGFGECFREIEKLRADNERMRVALEYIRRKAADKRNPAIAFVADKALRGEDPSPLRQAALTTGQTAGQDGK